MNKEHDTLSQRALILAPQGRDAFVASRILGEAGLVAEICNDLPKLLRELTLGAGLAVITEDSIRSADIKGLANWTSSQPPWSDFPFVILTERGAGLERNPAAERQTEALGNVTFLERPFHPTTLISVVKTALRGRLRQYDARARLDALHESESNAKRSEAALRRLNETLEARVAERTAEIEATNRQLVSQIEERERIELTLRQMQRLEAVGQLTTGVAHDFNNLLTVVLGNLGFVEKDLGSALDLKVKQRLSHMRLAAERGAKLTGQLLAFSRRQLLVPKPVDLSDTLANMHDLLQSTLGNSVQIKTSFKSGLWRAPPDRCVLKSRLVPWCSSPAMQTHPRLKTSTTHRSSESHLLVTNSPTRCKLPLPIVQATQAAKSLNLGDSRAFRMSALGHKRTCAVH